MNEENLAEIYPHLADAAGEDPGVILEMLEIFLIQTPELLQKMEEGLRPFDRASVYAASHTLKPTLRYLGLNRLYNLALQIEQDTRDEELTGDRVIVNATRLLSGVNQELGTIRELVRRHRNTLS